MVVSPSVGRRPERVSEPLRLTVYVLLCKRDTYGVSLSSEAGSAFCPERRSHPWRMQMAAQSDLSTQRRSPLSRERVLRAAIVLADTGGIEALTMRRLGQDLGVEAMSLYNLSLIHISEPT